MCHLTWYDAYFRNKEMHSIPSVPCHILIQISGNAK